MGDYRLIPMVGFILEQETTIPHEADYHQKNGQALFTKRIINYANFLSQKLKLWMLIPCDEGGNVLKKPEHYDAWAKYGDYTQHGSSITPECSKYKKAKERVLFEGFSIEHKKDDWYLLCYNGSKIDTFQEGQDLIIMGDATVEFITYLKPKLTSVAIKEIGLE